MKATFQKGFSLVQVMVAMGLLGAGAVTVMQVQKNNISANKKTETRYDVNSLAQDINTILIDENACRNTFNGRNFLAAAGTSNVFTQVRDGSVGGGQVVYGTGPVVANTINIDRYQYNITTPLAPTPSGQLTGAFRISFFYREASAILQNPNIYEKKIDHNFKVVTNPSGLLVNCFSDAGTDITQNVRNSCESLGGTFDEISLLCRLGNRSFSANPQITDISAANDNEGISFFSFRDQIIPNLLDRNFLQRTGGTLEDTLVINGRLVMAQNPIAETDVVTLGYIQNLLQCPAGTTGVYVRSTNSINCTSLMCNNSRTGSQQYLAGIDSNGNAICNPLVDTGDTACPSGGSLKVQPNGSVRFQCCTPACDNNANICSGIQYASTNSCGACSGTKAALNNEWSDWSDTGQFREAGACVGGVVQMEKRQTRLCGGGNECGVNNCTGNDERWVSSGSQGCLVACSPSWPVDNSANICVGHCIVQNDGCGRTRVLSGTSTETSPRCMQNAMGAGYGCTSAPLPRDGGWSAWGTWSACSGGTKIRTRTCTNPTPANGGAPCSGSSSEGSLCTTGTLPTTSGGSSGGGSTGPCITSGGAGGGMLDSGSNGGTTGVYQEPCLNPNPF